jgi:hypothetical protein
MILRRVRLTLLRVAAEFKVFPAGFGRSTIEGSSILAGLLVGRERDGAAVCYRITCWMVYRLRKSLKLLLVL